MVAAMFMSLFKSSPAAKLDQVPLMPRQMNLSGNIVNFAMPENFSKDMPAEDMIEKLDITNPAAYKDNSVTLLRRWWDFSEPGWFAKETGTLMMSVYVRTVQGEGSDITNPLSFVTLLGRQLRQRYEKENRDTAEEFRIQYSQYLNEFAEKQVNKNRWILHLTRILNGSQMAYHYVTPLTPAHYLEVEYVSAPAAEISLRHFIDTYSDPIIERIMNTFDVIYSNANPVVKSIESNQALQLGEMIQEVPQDKLQ